MASSSYYKSMINKYEKIKSQVLSLYEPLETCFGYITSGKEYVEQLIINNEPIDKGKLSDMSLMLESSRTALETVVAECILKIDEYQQLYQQALQREQIEKKNALATKQVDERFEVNMIN